MIWTEGHQIQANAGHCQHIAGVSSSASTPHSLALTMRAMMPGGGQLEDTLLTGVRCPKAPSRERRQGTPQAIGSYNWGETKDTCFRV